MRDQSTDIAPSGVRALLQHQPGSEPRNNPATALLSSKYLASHPAD